MVEQVEINNKLPSFFVFLIVVISFLYILSVFLVAEGGYSLLLLFVIFCYFCLLVSQLFISRKFSIFHPLLIYIVWREFVSGVFGDYMLLFNVNEIATAIGNFYSHESHEIILKLFSLKIVSILAFFIGLYSIKNRGIKQRLISRGDVNSLSLKLLILIVLMIALVFYLSTMVGGVGNLLTQRSVVYYERVSYLVGGHYHAIVRAIPIFLVLVACINTDYIKRPVFIFAVFFSYLCAFLVTGNRSVILTSVLMMVFVFLLNNRKIEWTKLIIVAVVVVVMFGVLGKVRTSSSDDVKGQTGLYDSVLFAYDEFKGRAINVNGVIPILHKVPEEIDWLYGKSYLSIPFIFIPSSLLSFEKPPAGGRITTRLIYQRDDTGIPPTSLGEAYWNFGVLGVFFVYFLLGLIIKFFYNSFKNSPQSPIIKFVYIYSVLSLSLASDSLFNLFQYFVISFILYFAFVFDFKKLSR